MTERCSGGAAASSSGAGGGVADAGPDACRPIMLDHTGETHGCTPDLALPDCPAVAAEDCPEAACLTGCIDFFLCTERGWKALAYCNDRGEVVVTPR
jgi:hypothetical protein